MITFSPLPVGGKRGVFSDLHHDNPLGLLEVKLMKVWVLSETGPPGIFNFQSQLILSLQQLLNYTISIPMGAGCRRNFCSYRCSITKLCLTLQPHGLQHARLSCCSLSPRVCPSSCSLSQWCYITISSSVIPFSFCFQSLPASGPFPVNQLFTSGSQSSWASASASVLPMNIQGWFPWGLTGLTSLLSKGLSRVFSSTTIWKHQFFGAQPSLWSESHIYTWLLEKP